MIETQSQGMSSRRLIGALAIAATLASLPTAVRAFDGIQFGPVDSRPSASGRTGGGDYDREFVREWEANPPPGFATLAVPNIAATKDAIRRYEGIVATGGWETVPEEEVKPGDTQFVVGVLRRRLLASGDLDADSGDGEFFDASVEKGVKRFQATNGLTPTGNVDKRTLLALNVSADKRLKQLKTNLGRLTEMATVVKGHARYVVVNIPAAQVEVIQDGKVYSRHTGVVGKPDRPTPLLRSTIVEMNFNPTWRLPPTVVSKDLIPKGREMQEAGKSVLVKFGIDAYANGKKLDPETIDWTSSAVQGYSYSQQPGKDNPLGFLKINVASSESVYMHDTPKDSLFGRNFRAASSGCIRVAGIEQLAEWLLVGNPGWSREVIDRLRDSGERRDIRLKKPVPLYFVYLTAWATPDGSIQFRRDLYNRDGAGESAATY
ncbi:MAG: L,D-transpeptidase family protein [Hyphomicrobium sp.]